MSHNIYYVKYSDQNIEVHILKIAVYYCLECRLQVKLGTIARRYPHNP
jgi:hypothetical protein